MYESSFSSLTRPCWRNETCISVIRRIYYFYAVLAIESQPNSMRRILIVRCVLDQGKLYLCSLFSETLASWQWSSNSHVTTEFDFHRRKVQFMVDVVHNLKKQHYKMESEFEEIESVKFVNVQGAPRGALLLQVSMKLALLKLDDHVAVLCFLFTVESDGFLTSSMYIIAWVCLSQIELNTGEHQ